MENSDKFKIVTNENIISKLCTREYIRNTTTHANVISIGSLGTFPQIGKI